MRISDWSSDVCSSDLSRIRYAASVKYPAGFQAASALDVASRAGGTVHYQPVPLDILVDSPVYAGRYFRTFDLAPGATVPVRLHVVAAAAQQLDAEPDKLEQHPEQARQYLGLFGSQHSDHYASPLSIGSTTLRERER